MSGELERRRPPARVHAPAWMSFRAWAAFFEALAAAATQLVFDRWLEETGRCVCCGDLVEGRAGELVACTLCYAHLEAGIRWDEVHPERSAAAEWEAHLAAIDGDAVEVDETDAAD